MQNLHEFRSPPCGCIQRLDYSYFEVLTLSVWAMVTVMHRDASASVRAVVACVDSCCGTGRTGIPLNMILDRPGPRASVGGTVERFG